MKKTSSRRRLRFITGDLYIKNPKMTMKMDREAAAVYGVSIDQVRKERYNCFGARQVATIYTAANDYQVILECDKQIQADPSGLGRVYLKTNLNGQATGGGNIAPAVGSGINGSTTPTGPSIPLSAVTRLVPSVGALQVNHQGQQPSMTISVNLEP